MNRTIPASGDTVRMNVLFAGSYDLSRYAVTEMTNSRGNDGGSRAMNQKEKKGRRCVR